MRRRSEHHVCCAAALVAVLGAGSVLLLGIEAHWAMLLRLFGCHLPVLLGAWRLSAPHGPFVVDGLPTSHRLLLTAYAYFSALIAAGVALGAVHAFTFPIAITTSAVLGGAMIYLARKRGGVCARRRGRLRVSSTLDVVLVAIILVTAWRCLSRPNYDYDVLTYHLFFPARWMQEGGITIVPTWFGDPAPAYSPLAAEMYYSWLTLPTGDDSVARCGQFPFWILLLLAVHALGREIGLKPRARAVVTALVALIPSIAAQAATAMVDVAFAAHFTAVVYFGLSLIRRADPSEAVGLILAFGLFVATKYLAIAYAISLLPLLVWVIRRSMPHMRRLIKRPIVFIALATACWIGGYWYVRNAVVTGNPVYPLEVRLDSWIVFDGAYGRGQMENSPYNLRRGDDPVGFEGVVNQSIHTRDLGFRRDAAFSSEGASPDSSAARILAGLFLLGAIFKLRAASGDRARWALYYFSAALGASFLWYSVPYHQPRFWWGPIALGVVGAAASAAVYRQLAWVLTALVALIGWQEFREEVSEILSASWTVWIAAILLASLLWWVSNRGPRAALPAIAPAAALICAVLISSQSPDARTAAFGLPRWRAAGLGDAWAYIDRHLRGVTIAYTGNNLPYFLCGCRMENRVMYVPARTELDGLFHNYAAAPEARRLGPPNTSEPAVDRYIMDPEAWLENLARKGVDFLLVTPLLPTQLLIVRHDESGYPIERRWIEALAEPTEGRPAYAQLEFAAPGGARLYRLCLPAEIPTDLGLPAIAREETDALDRMRQDATPPGRPIRDYPLAGGFIARFGLGPLESMR